MDLHVLIENRNRANRRRVKQQTQHQYAGRESNNPQQRKWAYRLAKAMKDLGLGRKSGYDPHSSYRREIFDIFTQMAHMKGEAFMASLSDAQLRSAVKTLARNISHTRDLPSKDPKGSSVTSGRFGGVLTQRAGYIDIDGNAVLEPKAGVGKGAVFRSVTKDSNIHALDMDGLASHDHPSVQAMHQVFAKNKPEFQHDTAVVLSADNKPFYLLGKITKTVKRAETRVGSYDIMIPRGLDYRTRPGRIPELKTTVKKNWWSNWRAEFRTENMAKIKTVKSKVFDEKFLTKQQEDAWKEAKPFYELRKLYREMSEALYKIQKKYHRSGQGYSTKPSKEDQEMITRLSVIEQGLEGVAKGIRPKFSLPGYDLAGMARDIHKAYTWHIWLMAAEHQFGILVRERQTLPENRDKPRVQNPTQPRDKHSAIQISGRDELPTWNLQALKGIGLNTNDLDAFETELKNSGYRYGYQSNRAITHLWVPLVNLEEYGLKLGLKLLPSDISDYLKHSTKLTRTEYIVGRENHAIKVDKQLPIPQFKFLHNGVAFSLIPAAGLLRFFDSPKHGGDRFVHGRGIVAAKLPKRSHYDKFFLRDHPEVVPQKGVYNYDPEQRRQDVEQMALQLFKRRFNMRRADARRKKEMSKRLAARRKVIADPGKPFSGYRTMHTRSGAKFRVSRRFRNTYDSPGLDQGKVRRQVPPRGTHRTTKFNFATRNVLGHNWEARAKTLMQNNRVPQLQQKYAIDALMGLDPYLRTIAHLPTPAMRARKENEYVAKRTKLLNGMSREQLVTAINKVLKNTNSFIK